MEVKQEKMPGVLESGMLNADVNMQQREIPSPTTVGLIMWAVLAVISVFTIFICVVVLLYCAPVPSEPQKAERYLPATPPVCTASADEKAELARVLHVPPTTISPPAARAPVLPTQQRETLSESTVYATTPYDITMMVLLGASVLLISSIPGLALFYDLRRLECKQRKAEQFLSAAT